MDFTDIEDQIDLNKERLKEESDRYQEIRSRIGFITIIYTLFAAFTFQLIALLFKNEDVTLIFKFSLGLFLLLFCASIIFSIILVIPVKVAHKDLPKYFYNDLKQQYLDADTPEEDLDIYIKHTYLDQLESALKKNFEINNRKSQFHYYAFLLALLAVVPYITCIGISLLNKKESTIKVELTNEIFNDMTEKSKSGKPNEVDSSKVIKKEPILIRENESKERQQRKGGSGSSKDK